jgi:hypothetical protein
MLGESYEEAQSGSKIIKAMCIKKLNTIYNDATRCYTRLILCYVQVFCASCVLRLAEVGELTLALTKCITKERAVM